MSLLSDLQLGKGYSGAKDTITKILSPLRHLSGTVGDIGRAAQALKMLPNQIRTKSDMVQVKATLRALNQVLKNSKISEFLNKLEKAVGNSIVGIVNPQYIDNVRKPKVDYDKNKVVQIVNGIRAARDSRIADQIKNILTNGKDFKDVVKILDRVRENDPKWGLGNILSLLPQNLMAQFAPKFLGAFKTADEFLGISKGIQNLVEGRSWNGGPRAPKVKPPTGVANSTSWNAATNIDKYKADLEAMGLDTANLKTDFESPVPVDALGAVYVDEIGEDGKPTGKKVVAFKNPFTDEEDLYSKTPTNQEILKEAIKDINPAPFEGYFRSRLGRLELASTHLWDLQIIPMSPGVPHLSMRDIDVLPITNWSLDAGQTLSDSMEMFGGSSITIPTTKKIDMRFEATFIEDSTFSIKAWLSKYKKFMFYNNRVRPYKDCCSIIGIWLLDVDLKELYYQAYVGYPIDMTEGLEGESSHSPINKTVTFSIVGQLSSKEFYEQIAVKGHDRHWDRTRMNTRYVTNFDRSKVVQMLKESDISKAYAKLKRHYEKKKGGLTENPQNITEDRADPATPTTSKKSAKPNKKDGKGDQGKKASSKATKKASAPKPKKKK